MIFIDITSFISKADDIKDVVALLQADVIKELRKEYPGCISQTTRSLASAFMEVRGETGNKFFVIIDEWDALFREAKDDVELQN